MNSYDFKTNGDIFFGDDYVGCVDLDADWCPNEINGCKVGKDTIRKEIANQIVNDEAQEGFIWPSQMLEMSGLAIYDLDPHAGTLLAAVGPANAVDPKGDAYDPKKIDADFLPSGFRLITDDEWEAWHMDLEVRFSADGRKRI